MQRGRIQRGRTRPAARRVAALVATTAALTAGVVAGAAPASAAPTAVITLTYDSSRSAEFAGAVAEGVANWNASVSSVRLVPVTSGQRATITIVADDGWPRATLGPVGPSGSATVWFGREAVAQGYDLSRIITHELGHNLGLDDNRTGRCADLMSGSSAPVDCANDLPSAEEAAEVQANYAARRAAPTEARVLVDAG
ncbi:snapalysin family zinc-dependent metalloprotease [Actinokineospora bangkokensis]|uniref:Extracellular small neutral protease n=1 Tax=Actinokineospora bangkokensis TaxID=1193682 RepID=A0A1Q9LJ42_9PSEU|nr:snapalysin family zinc-dependent metalloprotease [Actinokineospora bangkokensis]OLR92067.1 hypothetical protein BJP25_22185 [Actinokineospora bangkokensis]